MDEMGTMTATFEPTLDVWKLIDGRPTEYIVVNPVTIEATFRSGEVKRYPQEIRERVVRCRDCVHSGPCPLADSEKLICAFHDEMLVSPGDFCSWGVPMEAAR